MDNDEYTILSRKVEDKAEKYDTTFGRVINFSSNNEVSICSEDGKDSRDATIEELRELLDKYTQMDKFVEKMALELKVKF